MTLREAVLADVANLSIFATSTGDYVDLEDVLNAITRRMPDAVHITEGHEDGCPEYVVGRCVLSRGRPPEELATIISAEYRRSRGD